MKGINMEYFVLFTKRVGYTIEADSPEKAEQLALDMDTDKEAEIRWATMPYSEIEIEEEW
jgi:uncharacterized protein YmfQ (DUF2313 family)